MPCWLIRKLECMEKRNGEFFYTKKLITAVLKNDVHEEKRMLPRPVVEKCQF